MKTILATLALALTGGVMQVLAQSALKNNGATESNNLSKKAAQDAVLAFIKAGDDRNIVALEKLIHENFRALAHPPGTTIVQPVIESRAHYLTLIQEGKIGGKPRTVSLQSADVWTNTAIVRVEMESTELHFSSTFSLFYAPETGWQIVHDLVELQAKGS